MAHITGEVLTETEATSQEITTIILAKTTEAGDSEVGISVWLVIFVCVTMFGNTMVITAFAIERELRTPGNFFILNLAITDVLTGITTALWTWTQTQGKVFYKIYQILIFTSTTASAWSLAVISADRFYSVLEPVKYKAKLTKKVLMLLVTFPWVVGLVLYVPLLLIWEHVHLDYVSTPGTCLPPFMNSLAINLIGPALDFLMPFIIVCTCYGLLLKNVWVRSKGLASSEPTTAQVNRLRRDKKLVWSLALLIGVYGATWLPYILTSIANLLCSFCVPVLVLQIAACIMVCNSAVNPFIYPIMQHRFRRTFRRILLKPCPRPNNLVHVI